MGKSLVIGIDIGHHSIKAVALKLSKSTLTLVSYRELPIEDDIFTDNHMLNYQKIVKKLKELRKGFPLFSRKVALAIPDSAVISKVLQIDSDIETQEREFEIMLAFSQQSPLPVEELYLDFVEVTPKHTRSTSLSYQVYATKREVVTNRIQALSKAGFQPILADVQAHSLMHIWQLAARAQNRRDWLLLDIGMTQASVCMAPSDQAPFYKDIALGTQLVRQLESSERVDGGTDELVDALVDKLLRNIQWLASVPTAAIQGIWLSGGGSATPTVAQALARRVDVPCELLNPLSLFTSADDKLTLEPDIGCTYSTAAGLALRGVDWLEKQHVA